MDCLATEKLIKISGGRVLLDHVGGVFKIPSSFIRKWLTSMFGSRHLSLKRHVADKPNDVVSLLLVSKTEGTYKNISCAGLVILWNPEQEGSPRFNKICNDLKAAKASNPRVSQWCMVTVTPFQFPEESGILCLHGIFMWDVPRPLPLLKSNAVQVRCFFLNHGRRKGFSDALMALPWPKGMNFKVIEGIASRDPSLKATDLVINIHARPNPKAIELHRISRCLSMGCTVLSEGTSDEGTVSLISSLPFYLAPQGLGPHDFSFWVLEKVKELQVSLSFAQRQKAQNDFYSWFESLSSHIYFMTS